MNTISAHDFVKLTYSGTQLAVLDVRSYAEFDNEKVTGSRALPLHELNSETIEPALKELAAENFDCKNVYLMCQSGKRAELAIEKLNATNGVNFIVVEGGMNAAKVAGLKPEKGSSNVISIERQVRITAGLLVVTGVVLGTAVNNQFYFLSGFVGLGLTFAGVTDTCAMGILLSRMPWNTKQTKCAS